MDKDLYYFYDFYYLNAFRKYFSVFSSKLIKLLKNIKQKQCNVLLLQNLKIINFAKDFQILLINLIHAETLFKKFL